MSAHLFRASTLTTRPILVLLAAATLLASGCVPSRRAIQLDGGFAENPSQSVVLLPVVDARFEKLDHVLVSRNVRDAMVLFLREKNYVVKTERSFAVAPRAELGDLSIEELVSLAPEGTQDPIAIVQVERLQRETEELGLTYRITVSGFLIDPVTKVVLWQDRTVGMSSLNGLLTVFSRGAGHYEAALNAVRSLLVSLPDVTVPK
ncbi:MAG: hypothetical protein ACI8TX_002483 [Hyphomicrobiaceae bacterium]|jgi:hypothetical protein